jgi:hypothetical protein
MYKLMYKYSCFHNNRPLQLFCIYVLFGPYHLIEALPAARQRSSH